MLLDSAKFTHIFANLWLVSKVGKSFMYFKNVQNRASTKLLRQMMKVDEIDVEKNMRCT